MGYVIVGAMLLIYSGVCYYVGARFIGWVKLLAPVFPPWIFWALYALFCVGMIVAMTRRSGWMGYLSGIWGAILMYSFAVNILIDLVRQGSRLFQNGQAAFQNPSVFTGAFTLVVVAAVIAGGMINATIIKTARYDVAASGVTAEMDGMKIAVVSDMHLGVINGTNHTKRIVTAINETDADLVCIVGDIFDGEYDKAKELDEVEGVLRTIQSRYGVYAVFGNHDDNDPNGESAAFLKRCGITLLYNDVVTLDNGVVLVGRSDFLPIRPPGQQDRAELSELDWPNDSFVIVLDHQPQKEATTEARHANADLMISGHTHRGQLFPLGMLTARMYPNHYGILEHEGMTVAVTSGAATWGPPVRIGTDSEVMLLTLKKAE